MKIWEKFEMECTEYLNNNFGKYAGFIHFGGANSTTADILVRTNSGKNFYIDVKHSPAQCGQFVLTPRIETNLFEYSTQNSNSINEYAIVIMNYMNKFFGEYRNAGTAGKEIIFDNCQEVFAKWIIESYKNKNVQFFITNNYTILPVDRLNEYFDVSTKYRIKRSGSSSIGKTNIVAYAKLLSNDKAHNYNIRNVRIDGNKLFVSSDKNLHKLRFIHKYQEFMFSAKKGEYELRKLSNTYNANVIFSIRLKNNKSGISDSEFIEFLC